MMRISVCSFVILLFFVINFHQIFRLQLAKNMKFIWGKDERKFSLILLNIGLIIYFIFCLIRF
jgi:hypothetical protein